MIYFHTKKEISGSMISHKEFIPDERMKAEMRK